MSAIDDGGPAFPCDALDINLLRGVSVRDYFAAAAMQGFCVLPARVTLDPVKCAADSYALADAMLLARQPAPTTTSTAGAP